MSHIRKGLNDLIDALPDGHEIALISFGDEMRTIVDYTRHKGRLKAAATEFVRFSDTSAYMMPALVDTALALRTWANFMRKIGKEGEALKRLETFHQKLRELSPRNHANVRHSIPRRVCHR